MGVATWRRTPSMLWYKRIRDGFNHKMGWSLDDLLKGKGKWRCLALPALGTIFARFWTVTTAQASCPASRK